MTHSTSTSSQPLTRAALPGLLGRPRTLPASVGRLAVAASRVSTGVWLVAILLLAAGLRFVGLDWDQGQHLHPDERFLTMVETSLQWPSSNFLATYFDEATSTLNARNVGHTFFVYGDLPVIVIKAVALAVGRTGYDQVYLVGRVVDGLVDLGTESLVFLLGRRAYGDRRVALLGAALYACSALAIQQAHFFVVDNFSVFFTTFSLYWIVRFFQNGRILDYAVAGACGGLGIASKVSVYPIFGLIVVVAACRLVTLLKTHRIGGRAALVEQTLFRLLLAGLAAFVAFRIGQPYAFQTPDLTAISLAPRWIDNLLEARSWVSGERDAPFAHQWANRALFLFPWTNMVVWGLGLPLGLAAWTGWAAATWQLVRRSVWMHLVPVTWTALLFVVLGSQWVASMRYFLPIYPTLAILAAWLLVHVVDRGIELPTVPLELRLPAVPTATLGRVLVLAVVLGTGVYALAFTSIYTRTHTRVAASEWIFANVPSGSVIANETAWDDGLPLRVDGRDAFAQGTYQGLDLDITGDDSPAKLDHMLDVLDRADYLFISSNRQYDALPRIPVRFPLATRYYQALFGGQLGFERVAEFTSYPQVLFIPLMDQGAEEAWSIYDHPRVQIYHKTAAYARASVEQTLGTFNWSEIVRLNAREATTSRNGLMLTPAAQQADAAGSTWSDLFDLNGLANRAPLLVWGLALVVLGGVGMPYVWLAARGLPDRGFAIGAPVALLLIAWLSWWLASLQLVPFSRGEVWLSAVIVGLGAAAIAIAQRAAFARWLRRARGVLLLEAALFLMAFGVFVAVRSTNPDLWHPVLGGEKPMDFAFLNAVTRSSYFPPYDPWFAGGLINYYYFGFVLVAALIQATGIVPAVAYNLAIATWFAFLVLAAFGVVLGLVSATGTAERIGLRSRPVLWALMGSVFVCVVGNLGEVTLVLDALQAQSDLTFRSVIPGLELLVKSGDGLLRTVLTATPLPIHLEWWYWNPTRVISHAASEPGPITEFPWFTFLFGDLHAHLLALPYTVVALALVVSLVRQAPGRIPGRDLARFAPLPLLALVVGSLWPLNTWDLPTYALVVAIGFALRTWNRDRRVSKRLVGEVVAESCGVVILGYLAFLPFHQSSASPVSGIEPWTGSRTSLHDYLTINGFFLFVITSSMVADLWLARDLNPTARGVRLALRYWYRPRRLLLLHRRMVRLRRIDAVGWWLVGGGLALALGMWTIGLGAQAVATALLTLGLLLMARSDRLPAAEQHGQSSVLWQLTLGLACLGLALTLAVEFVVLKNIDIGRMNTVFKFYLQAWVLFGIAAAGGLPRLVQAVRSLDAAARRTWRGAFAVLFAATLLYPILATAARAQDRFDPSTGPTLDGMAFLDHAAYSPGGHDLELPDDADAIRWVQTTLAGSPVFAEMNTAPDLYGWGDRFAMFTGNPVVVGWDWHERQQRGQVPGDQVSRRIKDVQAAYASDDASFAYRTLEGYGVQYVVVGELENQYAPGGEAKWSAANGQLWDLVYQNPHVQIFHLRSNADAGGTTG